MPKVKTPSTSAIIRNRRNRTYPENSFQTDKNRPIRLCPPNKNGNSAVSNAGIAKMRTRRLRAVMRAKNKSHSFDEYAPQNPPTIIRRPTGHKSATATPLPRANGRRKNKNKRRRNQSGCLYRTPLAEIDKNARLRDDNPTMPTT